MRRTLVFLLAAAPVFGQGPVNPARAPARLLDFDRHAGEPALRCDVQPINPVLDFSFRFRAGYDVRVPAGQFRGKGHLLGVVMRVTPEGGAPVYLGSRLRLPDVPKTNISFELGGGYLLGEGRYRVAWKLYDDAGRVCRKEWKVNAHPGFSDRKVKMALDRGTVTPLYRRTRTRRNPDDAPPLRLSVMMHAAASSPRRTRVGARDNMMLLGTFSSLLDRLPARSVRLSVFNLDQQKVIYRRDGFTPDRLPDVARAIQALQLATVDYRVLQNRRGDVELLAGLVKGELASPEPPDVVLFLGPTTRYAEKFPDGILPKPAGGPRFFYLQYRPPFLRMQSVLPDLIHSLVSRLGGKVVVMNTPGDFDRGIRQIEQRPK